jgi:hypothetical protein
MEGDERVRFCASCQQHVYNLSALTRAEAEAIVRQRETERVCIGFYRRADGTVMTADCPLGLKALKTLRAAHRRGRLIAAAAVTLLGAVFYAMITWVDPPRPVGEGEKPRRVRDVAPFKLVMDLVAPEPPPPPNLPVISLGW